MSQIQAPRFYALGIGLLLSVLIAVATPYNEIMVKGSRLGLSSLTPAAFFLFLVWLIAVNPLLKTLIPRFALRRGELLLVFGMMMVATAWCYRGDVVDDQWHLLLCVGREPVGRSGDSLCKTLDGGTW